MDMRIPPLKIKILLESNPPKSRILVRRLAVWKQAAVCLAPSCRRDPPGSHPRRSAGLPVGTFANRDSDV